LIALFEHGFPVRTMIAIPETAGLIIHVDMPSIDGRLQLQVHLVQMQHYILHVLGSLSDVEEDP